jgi:YD repeat-containing protein
MEREFINTKRWIQILVVLILCLVISLVSIKQPRAGNVTYIYDQIHRVIRATYDDGTIIAFTYDRVGNRLVKNVLSNPTLVTMLSPNGGDFAPSGLYAHGSVGSTPSGREVQASALPGCWNVMVADRE